MRKRKFRVIGYILFKTSANEILSDLVRRLYEYENAN